MSSMPVSRTTKVALYGRVSTADQRADLQLDALRSLAEQRQWTVYEEYVDSGYSGTKDRRPALDRLMADARRGKFGVVAVWRFDRFGRSLRHLVTALDEFRDLGVQFVSTQDAIDTATPSGRMMYGVIAAMSQFEAELIRERTVAGLAAARRRGVRLGRRPVHVDVDRARELRGQGLSYRQLAAELRVSVGVVHRHLNSVEGVHQSSSATPSGTA
jgi:DNA invertase Pin-like site-specific DNA recombinase